MAKQDEASRPTTGHDKQPKGKPLGERIRDLVDGVLEALDEVIAPAPQPIPIPVRNRPYPYPRRR